MPLRPFALPISIGTDICSINRIRAIVSRGDDHFKRFLRRFLTREEQGEVLRRWGNADLTEPKALGNLSHFLAGRWAAKEATVKAVTWRKLSFHDVVIRSPQDGRGHVHAVILDDLVTNASWTRSASVSVDASHNTTEASHNDPSKESGPDLLGPSGRSAQLDHSKFEAAFAKGDAQRSNNATPEDESAESKANQLPSSDDSADLSGQIAQISISHDSGYATAVCLAARECMEGDVGDELAARSL